MMGGEPSLDEEGVRGDLDTGKTYYDKQDRSCQQNYLNV